MMFQGLARLSCVLLIAPLAVMAAPVEERDADTEYLITFGDSFSKTGFNPDSDRPSRFNPLGNPQLPGITSAGGRNWIGWMVTEFNRSTTLSYNFAQSGGTIDARLIKGTGPDMIEQVRWFNESIIRKPPYVPWTTKNSVVGVLIAINDIRESYFRENGLDLITQAVDQLFVQLQRVYSLGMRRFILMTVPPLDLTPNQLRLNHTMSGRLITSIEHYNRLLYEKLPQFNEQNPDIVSHIIDTAPIFWGAVREPEVYGAPDTFCANRNGVSCLWYDGDHPGQEIEKLMAAEVAKTLRTPKFRCYGSSGCITDQSEL